MSDIDPLKSVSQAVYQAQHMLYYHVHYGERLGLFDFSYASGALEGSVE